MRAFTAGENAILPLRSVESVKWVALIFMVTEHVHRYVLESFPAWVYLIGRTVFPLFAMCLGVALAGKWDRPQSMRTIRRLVFWCVIAAAGVWLVHPSFPINVLLTLALGLLAYMAARSRDVTGYFLAAVFVAGGLVAEFGPWGVLAVALCCGFGENQASARGYCWLLAAMACVCASQTTLAPLLALLLAAGISALQLDVPRIRHIFYWSYALQWPALAAAVIVLR